MIVVRSPIKEHDSPDRGEIQDQQLKKAADLEATHLLHNLDPSRDPDIEAEYARRGCLELCDASDKKIRFSHKGIDVPMN